MIILCHQRNNEVWGENILENWPQMSPLIHFFHLSISFWEILKLLHLKNYSKEYFLVNHELSILTQNWKIISLLKKVPSPYQCLQAPYIYWWFEDVQTLELKNQRPSEQLKIIIDNHKTYTKMQICTVMDNIITMYWSINYVQSQC